MTTDKKNEKRKKVIWLFHINPFYFTLHLVTWCKDYRKFSSKVCSKLKAIFPVKVDNENCFKVWNILILAYWKTFVQLTSRPFTSKLQRAGEMRAILIHNNPWNGLYVLTLYMLLILYRDDSNWIYMKSKIESMRHRRFS